MQLHCPKRSLSLRNTASGNEGDSWKCDMMKYGQLCTCTLTCPCLADRVVAHASVCSARMGSRNNELSTKLKR